MPNPADVPGTPIAPRPSPHLRCIGAALALLLSVGVSAACSGDDGGHEEGDDAGADTLSDAGDSGDSGGDSEFSGDGAQDGDHGADGDTSGDLAPDSDGGGPIDLGIAEGCNPLSPSRECLPPFPSRFFEVADPDSATGIRMAYDPDVLTPEGATRPIDAAPYNAADGAPPSGALFVHFGVDLADDFIAKRARTADTVTSDFPVALFNLETGERVPFLAEMDDNRREQAPGRAAYIIRPLAPMAMGVRHALAIRGPVADADGNELPVPPGFEALRDGLPTNHLGLEAARGAYADLFSFLDAHGYAREELFLAWDFQVASRDYVLGPVLSMRERAYEAVSSGEVEFEITNVIEAPNENTARIVEGTFAPPNFLTASNDLDFDDQHVPIEQESRVSYPFTLLVPAVANEHGDLLLTLLGHGIFGEGRDYIESDGIGGEIVQPLAQEAESVIVATDWIGLSGGDFDIIVSEVVPDVNRISVVTDRLVQSLINNLVLVELVLGPIQEDDRVFAGAGQLVQTGWVNYFGVSLGGIQGTSLTSISRNIERAVLSVPGSSWSNMISRSSVFTQIKPFFDAAFPDPLVQLTFLSLLQSRFDHSDPINLGTLMYRDPLDDAPNRTVIFQEAVGDCQVPNVTTEMLVRAVGARQLEPFVEPIWGVEPVTGPTTEPSVAQFLLPAALEYSPPDTNLLPERDNGVHSDMNFEESAQSQVLHLGATGEIAQFCDGACDPN